MVKVIVGMSGGVDSSVSAYLLKEKGYDVVGLSLRLVEQRGERVCCSLESVADAKRTAERLSIPHFTVDARAVFIEKVIEPFVKGYLKGVTPNPCILCNEYVKFPILLREAEKRGAQYIATGHYARIEKTDKGYSLKKGLDEKKDQSYFLYVLRKQWLERILFPLGEMIKAETRALAERLKLPSAERPESVEICFVGGNYACFIKEVVPEAGVSGPIIGPEGKILGRHRGIFHFTIGQRRGTGVSYTEPLYVEKIEPETGTVYLNRKEALLKRNVIVKDINWLEEFTPSVKARIRSTMKEEPATIEKQNNTVLLRFKEPQWAPAPGQSAVFYKGDTVLGGGIIK